MRAEMALKFTFQQTRREIHVRPIPPPYEYLWQ